jgi:hypothetical protein
MIMARSFLIVAVAGFFLLTPALDAQQATVTASVTILPAASSQLDASELAIGDDTDLSEPLIRHGSHARAGAIIMRELIEAESGSDSADGASGPWIRYTIAVDA